MRNLPKLIPLEEANANQEDAQKDEPAPLDLSKASKRKASEDDVPLDLTCKKAMCDDDLIIVRVESTKPKPSNRHIGYGVYKRVEHLPPPPPLHRQGPQNREMKRSSQYGFPQVSSPCAAPENLTKVQARDCRRPPSSDQTIMTALYNNTLQLNLQPRIVPRLDQTVFRCDKNAQSERISEQRAQHLYHDSPAYKERLNAGYHKSEMPNTEKLSDFRGSKGVPNKCNHQQLTDDRFTDHQKYPDPVPGIDLSKLDPNVIEQLERASSPRTRDILKRKFQESQNQVKKDPHPVPSFTEYKEQDLDAKNSFGVDMSPAKECSSPHVVSEKDTTDKDTVVKPVTSEFTAWQVNRFKRVPVANVNPIMQEAEAVESSVIPEQKENSTEASSAAGIETEKDDDVSEAPSVIHSQTNGELIHARDETVQSPQPSPVEVKKPVSQSSSVSSISLHLVTPKGRFKLNNSAPVSKSPVPSANSEPQTEKEEKGKQKKNEEKPVPKKKTKKDVKSKPQKREKSSSESSDEPCRKVCTLKYLSLYKQYNSNDKEQG